MEGWKSKDQGLAWHFRTIKPGNYKMLIKYLAAGEIAGGSYTLSFFRNTAETTKLEKDFQYKVLPAPGNTTVIIQDLGAVSLKAGSYNLMIYPITIQKSELMKLLEVQLIPMDKIK